MNSRDYIEIGFNSYKPEENEVGGTNAYKSFMRESIMLQVLLDIRELLIRQNGEPL